ncbi:ABC transporter ATP-binding protein [Campylobacter canadensis]|uniref:ABC transporter ATP-binding protein n=1 Tax=Campylobacter canadensis TaxID=449520 RepID=A0ABS7WPQ5_9BACT|nr:ABC transporter ATP-binding protein [Campylobacter canadensis]MBZ7986503.1 ABC transporter ATP-binding protein [Campylobacter canadensis]MBZ7997540.1 ABC transporter ATP-binding protein [Campylobacter canadensis]
MLEINNLSIYKSRKSILENISLKLEEGKIYAIAGPNGVGKSTLLDCIFGLIKSENISFNKETQKNLKKWQENIGYMLQHFHTHVDLSVLEVVLLGAYANLSLNIDKQIIDEALGLLDRFAIANKANENIQSLSGGQRQMVAFAQVLLKNPKILLLDEPVSALDLKHQCILLEALQKITKERRLLSIVVLHDLNLASLFCDEVILLKDKKLFAKGDAKTILTKDLIKNIYEVDSCIYKINDKNFAQILGSITKKIN